ncbi:FKBP-type peptidyl-prolyl cis-trans isomerase [Hymenobacter sp. BRD128]|uniref:FKBP-type peptidyl-prolyl cis-trans isomerase n=1 Tax=Hymenobacter sp. BRD128 TaxID=2675878 RepID=UPI001565C7FE|nr:FKBP-type peptidyl-prolyl cis-trans isomerase [Hymenobacter sp. BRD128]QKG56185.1 FKBP-type peptidyl-prolyl cis-trans isomerase [Hymenobacter sp. BRD128]
MKSSLFAAKFRLLALLLFATGSLLTTSCKKDDAVTDYSAADDAAIKKYLADNSITTAQKQTSGLYYVPVVTNASAALPKAGEVVSVLYTGTLLNGTVFFSTSQNDNTPVSFQLLPNQVIPGFAEGVSLMHKGDKAVFLIPSALAFGTTGSGTTVPANTVVRYEVQLVDINPSFAVPDDKLIQKYLTKNNITTAQKQASGLYFVPTVSNPSGTPAKAGTTASVLYTGRLLDGTVFDASSQHGNAPLTFVVGANPKQLIAGFDEGVSLMRKGEKATLLIPSGLAYGTTGASPSIAPNTVIIFDVEVTDVK